MGMFKVDIEELLRKRRTAQVFDHFDTYTDTQLWTKGGAGSTIANNDGDGGILTLTTDDVQNALAYVWSTRKNQTFVANKPMVFQTGIFYTEGSVNQCAIFAGFSSTTTDVLQNGTGVPKASFSGCGIYKGVGDTAWSAVSSVGATQKITQSKTSTLYPGVTQELTVQVMLNSAGQLEATFGAGPLGPTAISGAGSYGLTPMLNNVSGMSGLQQIKHFVPYTGAAAMTFGVFVLSGAAAGVAETVSVDYIGKEFLAIP